jgi:hypothetical protein
MATAIRGILLLSLSASVLSLFSADANDSPGLTGIVSLNDAELGSFKKAMIAFGTNPRLQPLLREGEQDGNLGVIKILPAVGKVVLTNSLSHQIIELALFRPVSESNGVPTFQFRFAPMGSVIDVLQDLSQRTVVASPDIFGRTLTFTTPDFKSRAEALAGLEQRIRTNGFLLKPVSDKFEIMVSADEAALFESISDPPKAVEEKKVSTAQDTIIAPGMLRFSHTDIWQVLQIYQELSGRTVISPQNLRAPGVSVHSQTAMSRQEAIWLLDAALRLSGVVMIPEIDKFVFAVPPAKTNGVPHFLRAAAQAKIKSPPPSPGLITLQNVAVEKLLELHGGISGRTPILPGPGFPAAKFSLRTQQPIDGPESLYALEAIAWVNDIVFETIGPDKIAATPLPQRTP